MWQTVKRFFVFQSKALEFKYRTWESRRAIRRAYRDKSATAGLFSFARAHARMIVLAAAGVVAGVLLYTTGIKTVLSLTSAYTTARTTAAAKHAAATAKPQAVVPVPPAAEATPVQKPETVKPAAPAQPAKPFDTSVAGQAAGLALLEDMQYCILANKATKTVFLLSKGGQGNGWKIEEKFSTVMGSNEGQKQAAGDRRTPEGIYFIVGRKDKVELNPLYGPLAYVLNYPNEEDRVAGRTGQGIWIHGMPEDSSRIVTRGCIVMQNTLLVALERYLKLGVGTPVLIVDKPDLASPEKYPDYNAIEQKRKAILSEYAQREQNFKEILLGWKNAWASRDINAYSLFYDAQRFFSAGMSWDAWRDRKKSIFQSLDSIEISVDNIRLVDCSESTAVVVFRQMYAASQQAARQPARQNAKRLCFYRDGSRWLIYREETFSTEEFLL
jgi:murein L,D-transpeptidase YafK